MIELTKKKIGLIAIYALSCFLIETITFAFNNYGIFPQYFMFFVAGLMILCVFLALFHDLKTIIWISSIFLFIQILISFANVNLLRITGEVFSWDMLTIIHEATRAAGKGISVTFLYLLFVLPLFFLFLKFSIGLHKKWMTMNVNAARKVKLLSAIATLLLVFVSFFVFELQVKGVEKSNTHQPDIVASDAYLLSTFYAKQEAYKKLGTLGYYMLSGIRTISNNLSGSYMENLRLELDQYFEENSNVDHANEFTGISSGNNIIVVLVETWEYAGIHPILTPNIFALLQESLLIGEYYSKDQTNISESKTIFGSYPLTGILNYNYEKNTFPFTLPSMFKKQYPQAPVVSFHNNQGTYYNRTNVNVRFGFDEHIDSSKMDLSVNKLWINLDSEMFSSILSSKEALTDRMIVSDDRSAPFFSFVTTFAGHGPFEYRSEFEAYYQTIDQFEGPYFSLLGHELDLTDIHTKTFIAAMMDLDVGVGFLMQELIEKDILDETTILFLSDHYAYYHSLASSSKEIPLDVVSEPEIYHVPAMLYDSKVVSKLKENPSLQNRHNVRTQLIHGREILTSFKFFTNTDVTPTLLNLSGIPYDKALYQGTDLFGPEESLILSRWGGIFNNRFYSNDGVVILNLPDHYRFFTEETLVSGMYSLENYRKTQQDIQKFRQSVDQFLLKYEMIDKMYLSDYFGVGQNNQ